MNVNSTKLSLEETCIKLCEEFDKNAADDELQDLINHAKESLGYIRDDQISQGAIKELVETLLVISLIQAKEISRLKLAMKK